jgi:hypothetical protein
MKRRNNKFIIAIVALIFGIAFVVIGRTHLQINYFIKLFILLIAFSSMIYIGRQSNGRRK